MSTLPPSLSSDEEDNSEIIKSSSSSTAKGKKKLKKSKKQLSKPSAPEDDEEGDNDEMNTEFEFGGLLGEDGDGTMNSILSADDFVDNSWSYKAALKLLQQNDAAVGKPDRTSVASIIAAARRNLKKTDEERDEINVKEEGDGEAPIKQDPESETPSQSGSSDVDGSGDSSSEEDDSDEEDEVDDKETAQQMQKDVLTIRQSKTGKNKAIKKEEEQGKDQSDEESDDDDDDEEGDSSDQESDSEDDEAKAEAEKAAQFFDSEDTANDTPSVDVFAQLNLSRPLLRGVASIGFVSPTPIQARVIPIALSGRDICASAQTGSGKTAAFLLPIMERILQRGGGRVQLKTSSKKANSLAAIRGLILTPTRELAAQCLGMLTAMAKFTGLRATLVVGGAKNVASQAAELRTRPDIVVASPGRLLDHLTNSSGVDLDDLEFLVLDEADRLLDLGFQDEIHEIVKSCPVERQTLLFSATMGTKVDDLIKLSLKRPVRIHVTDKKNNEDQKEKRNSAVEVANRLEQEFVRVRTGNEGVNREAMLLSLLTRTFTSRAIVFFDTKADAHRLMIICGLCGIKCAELHGNLTQVQRLEALEQFREGSVDILLATDLAARGLDISSVEAVINFEMPSNVETYVHRIGRTARAGRGGRSCTLIGEGRRHLMKEVIKDAEQKRKINSSKDKRSKSASTGVIRSRTIPPAVVSHFVAKVISLEPHIKEVIAAEAVAKMDRIAEMEAMKAQNIIMHGDEIKSRPQKEWFASTKQKLSVKEAAAQKQQQIAEKVGTGKHRMTRKKRRMREAKEELLAFQEEERREREESGKQGKKFLTDDNIKSTARAFKKKENDKQKERDGRSINDDDMQSKRSKLKKDSSKKRKGAFASDSLGDDSIFADERVTHQKKAKKEIGTPSSYKMREYNPDKPMRKHKQRSNKGFKSKAKHKRR